MTDVGTKRHRHPGGTLSPNFSTKLVDTVSPPRRTAKKVEIRTETRLANVPPEKDATKALLISLAHGTLKRESKLLRLAVPEQTYQSVVEMQACRREIPRFFTSLSVVW